MNAFKKACSSVAILAIFLSSIPAAQANYTGGPETVNAASARCNRLAGREKVRCQNTHKRGERLQLKRARIQSRQRRTARERRQVTENFSDRTIKGREGAMTRANRWHGLRGGNTRRQLQRGFAEAREKCRFVERTEKSSCLRSHMQRARRADYRGDR